MASNVWSAPGELSLAQILLRTIASDVEREVRDFLSEEVMPVEEVQALGYDEDLIGSGILNSLTLAHLAVFLEQRYGMTVEPAEFELDNFRTLRSICGFVGSKRAD